MKLLGAFNPLGDHPQAEAVGEGDGRGDDAGAGRDNEHIPGGGPVPELIEQPGLADPRRSLEQDDATLSCREAIERRVDRVQLVLALGLARLALPAYAGLVVITKDERWAVAWS